MAFLQKMYQRIGASRAIRKIIRSHREKIEASVPKNEELSFQDIEIAKDEP